MDAEAFLLNVISDAIESAVVGRVWKEAFASNGFADEQRGVSQRVCEIIGMSGCVSSAKQPDFAQLSECFPKRARVTKDMVYSPSVRNVAPLQRSKRFKNSAIADLSCIGRTRSATAKLAAQR